MKQRENRYNGLLVVDKPGGELNGNPHAGQDFPTSHDIVQKLRRWTKQRRIGHTGTLDPMASGVLLLCFGLATRLVEYYQGHKKGYLAEITLGQATNTYDALGTVTSCARIPPLTEKQIDQALDNFRGEVWQTPPIYSALKQKGESLHRKARRGEEVSVDQRCVIFHEVELLRYDPPSFDDPNIGGRILLRTTCSAGTYIRSLAHDLAQELSTVGHLSYLRREAAGSFSLDDSHRLAVIEAAATEGCFQELLLPLGTGLEMPIVSVDSAALTRLGHGQKVPLLKTATPTVKLDRCELAKAVDEKGRFVGLIRPLAPAENSGAFIWKAEKWFG